MLSIQIGLRSRSVPTPCSEALKLPSSLLPKTENFIPHRIEKCYIWKCYRSLD
ncbi:hypothetical protein [Moorena sp. SIO4G3]|uniref:hypothetical protein n=1 Tax=Moorena sp. SIO4G3 TaxID=2607821 RepID=UPI00142C48A6|nr:hypothetical protein [Moorena sp. SIO4G3]NEO78443.1 hypothetical protein [Moorena sp. SIO4G3]